MHACRTVVKWAETCLQGIKNACPSGQAVRHAAQDLASGSAGHGACGAKIDSLAISDLGIPRLAALGALRSVRQAASFALRRFVLRACLYRLVARLACFPKAICCGHSAARLARLARDLAALADPGVMGKPQQDQHAAHHLADAESTGHPKVDQQAGTQLT